MGVLTRREFMAVAGTAALGTVWPGRIRPDTLTLPEFPAPGPAGLGRATTYGVWVYEKPVAGARRVALLESDEVVALYAEVQGDALRPHNSLWYQTLDGYVYSSPVQPVEDSRQPAVPGVPATGLLAEVCVPFVNSRKLASDASARSYRLYYSMVFRIMEVATDAAGQIWYGLDDAGGFGVARYAPAESLRIIREADLAPLSPGADKHIHVSISKQLLEAYEGTRKVFEARVSSGARTLVDGQLRDNRTPEGAWRVWRKRATSHMIGGTPGWDYYDLLGVPFCTYFTTSLAAVHGAYWHNDFGRARSHGCLNVQASHARWVYRWTEPAVPYAAERAEAKEGGTPIEVVE